MRVLLTGATGLIGRQTAIELERAGHEVIAASRTGAPVAGAERTVAVDLLDQLSARDALDAAGAEGLVHAAWYGGPGRMTARANIDWAAATLRLVSDFSRCGGKHLVAAGSCAEYDWSRDVRHRESDSLAPQGLYGQSKARTGQMLCEAAASLGLVVAWARIFFVYGPGEPQGRLLGDLFHGFRTGQTVPCTDGEQVRDFLHVSDVARAMVAVLDAGVSGPVNIASGEGTRVRDLVTEAAQQSAAAQLVSLGARPRPDDDPASVIADTSKLKSQTGFVPTFDLRSGIANVVEQERHS